MLSRTIPTNCKTNSRHWPGPSAGPSGGQIYIDGFTGGQIPPKSSIREIRVNQNPFSAEFDKIGYGRIEILTKPGSDKFSGHITSLGNDSAWNTANPLVQQQPSYYLYFIQADVNGPLTKNASYFFSLFRFDRQNQSIIDAVNPQDTSTSFNEALPNPSSLLVANPRVDFQFGKSNTLSVRDSYVSFRRNGEWSWSTQPSGTGIQREQSGKCHPGQRHGGGQPARDQRNPFSMAPRPQQPGRLLLHSDGYGSRRLYNRGKQLRALRKTTRISLNCRIIPLQPRAATPYGLEPVCAAYRDANYSTAGIERKLSIHFGRPVPGADARAISGHSDSESAGACAFVRWSSFLSGRLAY